MENRLNSLDALRGLLATWVLVAHVASRVLSDETVRKLHLQAALEPLTPVYVFMILSGFVIFHLLHREYGGYRDFMIRRFFRLAPLYFFVLPISVAAVGFELRTLEALPWRNGDITDSINVHRETLAHLWSHVVAHISMLHGAISDRFLKDAPFSFLSQGWSVSLEWQFYLSAPLLFLLAKSGRYLWLALVLVILIVLGRFGYYAVGYFPSQLHYFAVGILSYNTYRHSAWYVGMNATLRTFLLLLAFGAIYFGTSNPLVWMVWFAAMHVLLTSKSNPTSLLSRISDSRVLLWLGEVSYSVYLLHIPILYVVFALLLWLSRSWEQWHFLILALVLVVLLTLALAGLTHKFIERPGIRTGRNFAKRLTVVE